MQLLRRYVLYLIRWQLSTPILAPVIAFFKHSPSMFGTFEDWLGSAVANLIGGLIFFWVDRWIFGRTDILRGEVWEVREAIACADCGLMADHGYRLVKAANYDKSNDRKPEFRCQTCSLTKYEHDRGRPSAGAGPPLG